MPPGGEVRAYICQPGDEDWFSIALRAGQTITATLSDLPLDYDLALYDGDGEQVARSDYKGTRTEVVTHIAAQDGIHALQISALGDLYDAARPYRLHVALSPMPARIHMPLVWKDE